MSGTAEGEAHFAPSGQSLVYEEHGTVSFGAHHGPAEQQSVFEFPSGPSRATVKFRDGRIFHELDLSQGQAAVSHVCEPDFYEGVFVAMNADAWQSTWDVTGPRKDQKIVTLYTRLS